MTSWDFPGGPVVKTPHFQSKLWFFPVVIYGCESWTIKKAEHQRIDAFKLWCWRRLLRGPWTARKSNQSKLKEINPEYSLKGLKLMLKLKLPGLISPWRTKIPHASWYSQKKKKRSYFIPFLELWFKFLYFDFEICWNYTSTQFLPFKNLSLSWNWSPWQMNKSIYICVCVCIFIYIYIKAKLVWDFSGGSVVGLLCFQCHGQGSLPGRGIKILQAA